MNPGVPLARGPLPSIRTRLANALVGWSLAWGIAIGIGVWLAASHEVDELLDDTLQSSAGLIAAIVSELPAVPATSPAAVANGNGPHAERFAWQVTAPDGGLLLRSPLAPAQAWAAAPGFGKAPGWRLYGLTLGSGQLLVVAQSEQERREVRSDVAVSVLLATLVVGLLGHIWLRARVGAELEPLRELSRQLADWNVDADPRLQSLGAPARTELQPVHASLSLLADRLSTRLANERAFSAHAAHALRTPLAGIDAQLAVALRDCPDTLRPRLQRAREAAHRLQTVVAALIGLFRSGGEIRRQDLDVAALVARLPTTSLGTVVEPGALAWADADLVSAALANLLDNAQRLGATQVHIAGLAGNVVRLTDDGPGVDEAQRRVLQEQLARGDGGDAVGLGLMLADRVARAHGGRLRILALDRGFGVELELGRRDPSLPGIPG